MQKKQTNSNLTPKPKQIQNQQNHQVNRKSKQPKQIKSNNPKLNIDQPVKITPHPKPNNQNKQANNRNKSANNPKQQTSNRKPTT